MDKEGMNQYFETYSTDFNRAIDTYYTDDIDFEYPGGKYNGKDAVKAYFGKVHEKFNEILRPIHLIMEGDKVAAEVEAELQALIDFPDFGGKPFNKGESQFTTYGIFYGLRDDKICRVKIYRP